MGIHLAFLIVTVVAWVFALLGVVSHDEMVRDVGLLVGMAALAIGLTVESDTVRAWREARAAAPARVPPVRRTAPPAPERDEALGALEAVAPAPPAPSPEPATRARWGQTAGAWEAKAAAAPAPVPSPREAPAVVSVAAGNGNGHTEPDRLTRGMCGKCQSPITVSSRRPIRVTCPVCGHAKLLQ